MSFVRRQVGLRTDAANASGSLHGKVGELLSQFNNIPKFPYPISISSFASATLNYVTAYSRTGKGSIYVAGKGPITSDQYPAFGTIYIEVIADGKSLGEQFRGGGSPCLYGFLGNALIEIKYKSNVIVKMKTIQPSGHSGYNGVVYWVDYINT